MKERFLEKMYAEYQAYRISALSCPSAEIFSRSHEIDAITNFYEILVEKAGELQTRFWKSFCHARMSCQSCMICGLKRKTAIM